MSIEIRKVNKNYGKFCALSDINLSVPDGELTAILGPSGSGKSTLLRIIGGLETPDSGEVFLNGHSSFDLKPRQRNVGFVFQHYALFRNMTVAENIGFGLKVRKMTVPEINARVEQLIRLVQLRGMENRYPHQLSGGQRQRVAVARALAPEPSVLLLDEPFGALDAKVREELREWMRSLHEESHVTTLFVTHDQLEALEVASQIVVMNQGRIEQTGAPELVFDAPRNRFVAEFVGESGKLLATATEPEVATWGDFRFPVLPKFSPGQSLHIYYRPGDVYVSRKMDTLQVKGIIDRMHFRGPTIEMRIRISPFEGEPRIVIAHLPKGLSEASGFRTGDPVYVGIAGFHVFPPD